MNFQQLRIIRETVRCNFNLTDVAGGRYPRGFAYRFIALCSPALTEDAVRGAASAGGQH